MPFNGSGTFTVYTPGTPYVNGTTIDETVVNAVNTDFATGLTNCITKDGQTTPTANIPLGGFKLTGLAAATANGDAVRWQQSAPGVLTTQGDTLYASAANTPARLAIGAAGAMLAVNAGATAPAWQAMATQADQETGTSVLAPVTPGRQQYHQSAIKAWCDAGVSGDINASYNIASVTDVGTGEITFNFTTAFSSINYSRVASIYSPGAPTCLAVVERGDVARSASASRWACLNTTNSATDPTYWYFMAAGDQ